MVETKALTAEVCKDVNGWLGRAAAAWEFPVVTGQLQPTRTRRSCGKMPSMEVEVGYDISMTGR